MAEQELEVQKFLRILPKLQVLAEKYGIEHTFSDCGELVILNYSQIDSPKTERIVQECRGLTLQVGTWDVVARAFPRFFNLGENLEQTQAFDWSNFTCQSKEDGSLILLYQYKGNWKINTRGSFGQGEVNRSGYTWANLFEQALSQAKLYELWTRGILNGKYTYVFEMATPFNRIVTPYEGINLFLLTVVNNKTGAELSSERVYDIAAHMGVKLPQTYTLRSLEEIEKLIAAQPDTFEGVVLRDQNGVRLKVKSARYLALHRMHGNGNICLAKNLVPLALSNEGDEWLTYFPDAKPYYLAVKAKLETELENLLTVYGEAARIESQKDFANYVLPRTKLSSILFQARKTGKPVREIWNVSADLLTKVLFKESLDVTA